MLMLRKTVATALLAAGTASAQLLIAPQSSSWIKSESHLSASNSFLNIIKSGQLDPQALLQKPHGSSNYLDTMPYEAGQFTLRPQSNKTCATYGERQWTGTVDVTDSKRLFFWAFESRNDPANDPVIFWMNGGPGGSSMMGQFNEMGACWLEPGESTTVPNPWSWNNNATLIFLEQPAGVGLSTVFSAKHRAKTDNDGMQDFQQFLNILFEKVFPEKAHLPIHITGESYGGHYVPTYVNHILESRRYDSKSAFWGNISSVILIDALLDFNGLHIGQYELLCTQERTKGILNETECQAIASQIPEMEKLGQTCQLSGDGNDCTASFFYGATNIDQYYQAKVMKGERNPYNTQIGCPVEYPLCPDPRRGNFTAYLNLPHIKKELGFSPSFLYESINMELNQDYTSSGICFKPTTPLVGAILEAYRTPSLVRPDTVPSIGDIKLLLLNGNDDWIVNTPGARRGADLIPWGGMAEYKTSKWRTLTEKQYGNQVSGEWKATKDGRLAFIGMDGSGHTLPGDLREGSYRVLQKWIAGDWHF